MIPCTRRSIARPSWRQRLLGFPPIRVVLALLFVLLPVFLAQVALHLPAVLLLPWRAAALTAASVFTGTAGYLLYVRWVERRAADELGGRGALAEWAGGLLLGAALFAGTMLLLGWLGVFTLGARREWQALLPPLGGALVAGVVEELVFRGILFRLVEGSLGSWLALAISATLFGLAHLGNTHPSALGILAIMLEAGLLLGAAYMLTRRLWLPIGIHLAWNFTQEGVFGIAVSGTPATGGLFGGSLGGPDWLSGGSFGAEASVVAVGLCLAASLVLLALAARRGHIVKPFWRRAPPQFSA